MYREPNMGLNKVRSFVGKRQFVFKVRLAKAACITKSDQFWRKRERKVSKRRIISISLIAMQDVWTRDRYICIFRRLRCGI